MNSRHHNPRRLDSSTTASFNELWNTAGEQFARLTQWMQEQGGEFVEQQKSSAAEEVAKVGGALRRASEKLGDQQSDAAAHYTQLAADRVEQTARYLKQRQVNELLDDASELVRQKPALFLGGMFLAGLAAARFVKAASTEAETSSHSRRKPH